MYAFNAEVKGYFSDAYVEWHLASEDDDEGGWQGFFDYNVGWITRKGVDEVLTPGLFTLEEQASDYEIEILEVTERQKGIYRARFRGIGEAPLRRTWKRARELSSTKSWDQQVMEKIERDRKAAQGPCLIPFLVAATIPAAAWLLFL